MVFSPLALIVTFPLVISRHINVEGLVIVSIVANYLDFLLNIHAKCTDNAHHLEVTSRLDYVQCIEARNWHSLLLPLHRFTVKSLDAQTLQFLPLHWPRPGKKLSERRTAVSLRQRFHNHLRAEHRGWLRFELQSEKFSGLPLIICVLLLLFTFILRL